MNNETEVVEMTMATVLSSITEVFPMRAADMAAMMPPGFPPTITKSYEDWANRLDPLSNRESNNNFFFPIILYLLYFLLINTS